MQWLSQHVESHKESWADSQNPRYELYFQLTLYLMYLNLVPDFEKLWYRNCTSLSFFLKKKKKKKAWLVSKSWNKLVFCKALLFHKSGLYSKLSKLSYKISIKSIFAIVWLQCFSFKTNRKHTEVYDNYHSCMN